MKRLIRYLKEYRKECIIGPAFKLLEGLGLAIVKHVAALHQGEITVESEAGQGTEITIAFK